MVEGRRASGLTTQEAFSILRDAGLGSLVQDGDARSAVAARSRRFLEREFTRPAPGGGTAAPTDADVFRAVLGGGPSSFGVVTELRFDLVADGEYPGSAGYSYSYLYLYLFGQTKEGLRAAMEPFRQSVDGQCIGELPPGIDLFLTIVSRDFPRPRYTAHDRPDPSPIGRI